MTGEQRVFPRQGNRAFIVPMSGKIASFTIAGTLISDGGYALKGSKIARAASWPLSKYSQAWSSR